MKKFTILMGVCAFTLATQVWGEEYYVDSLDEDLVAVELVANYYQDEENNLSEVYGTYETDEGFDEPLSFFNMEDEESDELLAPWGTERTRREDVASFVEERSSRPHRRYADEIEDNEGEEQAYPSQERVPSRRQGAVAGRPKIVAQGEKLGRSRGTKPKAKQGRVVQGRKGTPKKQGSAVARGRKPAVQSEKGVAARSRYSKERAKGQRNKREMVQRAKKPMRKNGEVAQKRGARVQVLEE